MDIDPTEITLEDGYIKLNGTIVGHMNWSGNVLLDISVEETYQNNGIATEALSRKVDELLSDSQYTEVRTGAVVSSSMVTVLQKCGFKLITVPDERGRGKQIGRYTTAN
jgi:RimJ/RimL family protein N-acetyltransferase